MRQLLGFYNQFGYRIHMTDEAGQVADSVYEAGNSPDDSTVVVSLDQPHETLGMLKSQCNQTGEELAIEHDVPWGGCQQEEDPDEMMHPEELEW
jgi:hypothetical protein